MALKIDAKRCKGCNICVTFCPKQVLGLSDMGKVYAIDEKNCIKCKQCELRCPDYAIFVKNDK